MTPDAAALRCTLPAAESRLWRRAVIGALGGLIGLGGAEFRLPILIGFFGSWHFGRSCWKVPPRSC